MEGLVYGLLLVAGFGAMWWQRARMVRRLGPARSQLGDDVEVALHLAAHEARSRGTDPLPLHVLFALVQDEGIATAIRRVGGDVDAIEDRIFDELDAAEADHAATRDAMRVVAWAVFAARGHERLATCADLWCGLVQLAPETARLVEVGGVRAADVLFTLVHGVADDATGPEQGEVEVILVNDDITTQELVVEVLCEIFELDADEANQRMLEAHRSGHGVVGRYPAATARARIEAAQRRARTRGFPLWLRAQ